MRYLRRSRKRKIIFQEIVTGILICLMFYLWLLCVGIIGGV